MNIADVDIFLGLDVGKTDHWGCAVTADGTIIWNKTLPNDEAKLTKVYQDLSKRGTVLVVVDQPATIGAWPSRSPSTSASSRWPGGNDQRT